MKRVAGVLLAGLMLTAPAMAILASMPVVRAEAGSIGGVWAGNGGDTGPTLEPNA